ncbi:MAG: PKD domain-containing protein [Candidatus Thermoplasmatota archaeon]|nr:PKD domain-containing protein [Candidatus Thermoplasmatota archaeon]
MHTKKEQRRTQRQHILIILCAVCLWLLVVSGGCTVVRPDPVHHSPLAPYDPQPENNATDVDINIVVRWNGSYPGSHNTYDVYFGTTSAPPLIIHNQSNISYDPGTLNYNTQYYWQVVAWDTDHVSNASAIWRFTTTQNPSGGGGGGDNAKPVADASAGEPYTGFVNQEITFDGSKSLDPDGQIVGYRWDFTKDGTYETPWLTSPTATHVYTETGTYDVVLQVKDDAGATDTDQTHATILQPNMPPTIPVLEGPTTGHVNITYNFSTVSTDADNDEIQYHFDWGDGDTSTSAFVENGTSVQLSHSWSHYGEYHIAVTAFDGTTESAAVMSLAVDVLPITGPLQGYLVDADSQLPYEFFDNTLTGQHTSLGQEGSTYLIDSNGDGTWDYTYSAESEVTTYFTYVYQKYYTIYQNTPKTPGFELLSLLAMLALVCLLLQRRRVP